MHVFNYFAIFDVLTSLVILTEFSVLSSTDAEVRSVSKRGLTDDEDSSITGTSSRCVICDGKSQIIIYGQRTCANCQIAISRVRTSKPKMYCKKGGNCDVTDRNIKRRCMTCRFEKAKRLGMNVEKPRIESQSNVATDTNFLANLPGPSRNFFFPTSHQDNFLRSNTVRENMFSSQDTLRHSAESQDRSELTGAPFPNAYWSSQGNAIDSSTFSAGVPRNEGLLTARWPSVYSEDKPRTIQKIPNVLFNSYSQDFPYNKISVVADKPSKFQSNIRQFTQPASFTPFSSLNHYTSPQMTSVSEASSGFPFTSTSTMGNENSENDLPRHNPPSRGFPISNQQNNPNPPLELSFKGNPEEAATSYTSSSGNSAQKDDTKPSASKNNNKKSLNNVLEFLKHRQENKKP